MKTVSGLLRTGSKLREVIGAGNNTGCIFFSPAGDTLRDLERLKRVTKRFTQANMDIRDGSIIEQLFRRYVIDHLSSVDGIRSVRLGFGSAAERRVEVASSALWEPEC